MSKTSIPALSVEIKVFIFQNIVFNRILGIIERKY